MPVSALDAVTLTRAMVHADADWRQEAAREVINAFDSNSSLLVDLVPLLDDDEYKSMAAHVLLLSIRKHRLELASILPKLATVWLDAPHDEEQVLGALFDTNQNSTDANLLQRFLKGASVHPRGSLLRTSS